MWRGRPKLTTAGHLQSRHKTWFDRHQIPVKHLAVRKERAGKGLHVYALSTDVQSATTSRPLSLISLTKRPWTTSQANIQKLLGTERQVEAFRLHEICSNQEAGNLTTCELKGFRNSPKLCMFQNKSDSIQEKELHVNSKASETRQNCASFRTSHQKLAKTVHLSEQVRFYPYDTRACSFLPVFPRLSGQEAC